MKKENNVTYESIKAEKKYFGSLAPSLCRKKQTV